MTTVRDLSEFSRGEVGGGGGCGDFQLGVENDVTLPNHANEIS